MPCIQDLGVRVSSQITWINLSVTDECVLLRVSGNRTTWIKLPVAVRQVYVVCLYREGLVTGDDNVIVSQDPGLNIPHLLVKDNFKIFSKIENFD